MMVYVVWFAWCGEEGGIDRIFSNKQDALQYTANEHKRLNDKHVGEFWFEIYAYELL